MSDWALAIALDSQRNGADHRRSQANANTIWARPAGADIMRRLVVTLNTQHPPSRQLLTVVQCCQCGHRSGLPTDYSTPYQCLGYSGHYGGYVNHVATHSWDSSISGTSTNDSSPQNTSLDGEEQRVACRHVYCLGCHWLVNGVFRTLHPIEIRDETDYSAAGYGPSSTQQDGSQGQSSSGKGRSRGSRRSRS